MPLVESIFSLFASSVGIASSYKDLKDYLKEKLNVEDVLTEIVADSIKSQLPRLQHLCKTGTPNFDKQGFKRCLEKEAFILTAPEDLPASLLPALRASVITPGATCHESEFDPIFHSILMSASRGLWDKLAHAPAAVNRVSLEQAQKLLQKADGIVAEQKSTKEDLAEVQKKLDRLIGELADFSKGAWKSYYDQLTDTAPPGEHTIDSEVYENPFLLARAEDFNHNYSKLAKLFQTSIEWESLQRRTDNVFLEGGRGTGKSMLLRRLTAQTVIAANRLDHQNVTFETLKEDYFGIYIKLTRGYYEQFTSIEKVPAVVGELLAQHELNIEIADAFVEALRWLVRERCITSLEGKIPLLLNDLNNLFPRSKEAPSLDEFQSTVLKFEQDQMHGYYRENAFGNTSSYEGSAEQTVTFLRNLSKIFRNRIFPEREIRLFLLIDEFETLLPVQQIAINTVIKMRLPDLTLKIGVRKAGRRTHETFTPGDPIQDPRDYTEIRLDYDADSEEYASLLKGIAEKRLSVSGYENKSIEAYLPGLSTSQEVKEEELDVELAEMWNSGRRRSKYPTETFRNHATTAAVYRVLAKRKSRKSFAGFSQYALLSSGIVSNYIELCKYAFFFALSDHLPLKINPSIPSYLQTNAAYSVSERLFDTIDGNVPVVGGILKQLVSDLGNILRNRLLHHSSEPEANRLEINDFNQIGGVENKMVEDVLNGAIIWSVFHLDGVSRSFLPKNTSRPPQVQLIINRIYAPTLGFSPRARWRVNVSVRDLREMTNPDKRERAFRRLMKSIGSESENIEQTEFRNL